MSPSHCYASRRAARWLLISLIVCGRLAALDPDTVFLQVTQAQKLADGRYQVTLQWNALSGATYQVQGQEGLSGTGWLDFGLVTPPGATGQWTGTIAAGLVDEARFFMRLVLPQEKISSLEPAFVASSGGVFYILGQCFAPTDRVFINGAEAVVVVFEDHTRLKVTVPAMAAGVYDVEVRGSDGTTVHAKLTDSLTVNATGRSDEVPPSHPIVNATSRYNGVMDTYKVRGGGGEFRNIPTASRFIQIRDNDANPADGRILAPTGELVLGGVDIMVPGRGLNFIWARTYRSKQGPSTAQGEGWDFSYNISAAQTGTDVVVRDGEGREDTFFDQGDGTWSRPEFFRQGTMSGTVFTLMFADKGTWRFRAFDAAVAPGKIDRITDRNGNHLDFAYDGAGRLTTVTDPVGRDYTVAYNGAGRIASVTDFSGRAVTYGYDAEGNLTTATSPPVTGTPTGNDFPAGKTTTFTYSTGFADPRLNHNLLTVTDALGQLVLQNTYAPTTVTTSLEFDRCIQQVRGGALAETSTFTYLPLTPGAANRYATTLAIINDLGNVTEVRSDSQNRPLEVREYTGRSTPGAFVTDSLNRPTGQLRAGDPPFFATKSDWNRNSLPVRITLPRGGMIESTFQCDLTVIINPREAANLRVQTTTAAPSVPSDFSTITRAWEYLPGFGTCESGGWRGIDSSRYLMVDGTPVVSDVLFTKSGAGLTREQIEDCTAHNGGCSTGPLRITPFDHPDPDLGIPGLETTIPGFDWMPTFGNSPAPQPTTTVPNAEGMVDLFNSNAAKSSGALGTPRNAVLFEAYTKGMVGASKSAQLPAFNRGYRPGKLGANLVGVNLTGSFPSSHTDGRGNVTIFGYDLFGNTTSVNPPVAGTGHTFEYNGFGQPTAHVWPQNANGSARRDEFIYYTTGPQTGLLQSVEVDVNGFDFLTAFEYGLVAALLKVTDPLGRDTLITRNSLNQPVRITSREASAGVRYETDIRYDANNNVTSVDVQNKDETGALVAANPYFTTLYQYDTLNRPTAVTREVDSATNITTERVIDAGNHTVTVRSPEAVAGTQPQNTLRIAFDERGLPFQTTLAPGAAGQSTTQYDYDLDGNLAVIQCGMEVVPWLWFLAWDGNPGLALGARRDYEREPTSVDMPNLVITLAESHSKALYDWHEDFVIGCLDRCVDPDEDDYGTSQAILRSVTDPMGNKTTWTRDANGNLVKLRVDGEHTDVPGDTGNVRLAEFHFAVDNNDLPVVFTGLLLDPSGAQTGSVAASVTRAPNGQPASVTDPRGNTTTFGYDTTNRLALVTDAKTNTRAFSFDANGNVLTVTATDKSDLGNPNQVFIVTRTFDGLDRQLTRADNVGNTAQCAYDSRSNLVLHTDARNIQTRYEYDGLSRPLSSARDMDNDGAIGADPQDIVLSRTWDRNSRLATTTNANGFVTTHSYDALNRRTSTVEADGTTSGSDVFDVHHNVTQSTDANGTVIAYAYDSLNRLTGKNIAPGAGVANTTTNETFDYDGLSRLKTAVTNGSAPTSLSRTYDSLSRLLTETQGAHTVTYGYDAAGNVTSVVYPGGNTVASTYDSLNRPLVVTDSVSGAVIAHSYIGPDRVERQNHGNGTITSYQYDGVQGVPNAPGDLGWRQVRAKFVTGPGGTPVHDSRQYFYDANQNPVQRINVPIGLAHIHTLDNADRLVNTIVQQGGPPIRNTNYALDKAGNRQNVSGDLHPGVYQMDPTLPNPGDAQMNQYTIAPTGQFTYDANGSRQNHNTGTATLQHQYDYANRLVAVNNLTTAQPVAVYQYDAFSRRARKVTFPGGVTTTTNFVFNGGGIIEERDGGGAVQATLFASRLMEEEGMFYYFSAARQATYRDNEDCVWIISCPTGRARFGPDLLPPWNTALVNRGGNLQVPHADPNGSVMLITNAAGLPAERYDYQDFGEPQFFSAAYAPQTGSVLGNPILFCGWRYDSETGNYRTGKYSFWDYCFGGGGSGKANVQDISVTRSVDRSSTKLAQAAATSRHIKQAEIGLPAASTDKQGYFDPKTGSWISR